MKVSFDPLPTGWSYPLSKEQLELGARSLPSELSARIRRVNFRFNQSSSQEARIRLSSGGGEVFVNFCLKDGTSRLLPYSAKERKVIVKLGGRIREELKIVLWDELAARRYAMFLFAHEVAHIAYIDKFLGGDPGGTHSGPHEEQWCDEFALDFVLGLSI